MPRFVLASLPLLAVLAGPAMAQEQAGQPAPPISGSQGTVGQSTTGESAVSESLSSQHSVESPGASGTGSQGSAAPPRASDMLGKTVMMQDGKPLGAIADVVLQDGKPSAAVVEVESQKKRQVTVTMDKLLHNQGEYQIALTEPEIRTLPPYNGPKEGETAASERGGK